MTKISIISSSVRAERKSHRVALYFKNYLIENNLATAEILDLKNYNFSIFDGRLKDQKTPSVQALDFAEKIKSSAGIIIVTPEYNGGYPASLKNVIDLLYDEWYHKPIAIATVSAGVFGGSQVITSLQFSLWKIRAWMVPVTFPVSKVEEAFDEHGNATDKTQINKQAEVFTKELLWCMEANKRMLRPAPAFVNT
jgi:NAD(P)H-dependent FMN reductase